ncbi:MAG: nucleotidyltransferase domain-containing protein [Candidatus Dormibacteria bacterium]
MRLISSELALSQVLALEAGGELRLSALARATEVTPSAAQRALSILVDDGVVERRGELVPVYSLVKNSLAASVLGLAMQVAALPTAVAIAARASPALEFVARESQALVAVLASNETSAARSRVARYLEALGAQNEINVRFLEHDDVRKELLIGASLRNQMRRATVLYGDLKQSFPDRSRHGLRRGRPLGRPHPDLKLPAPRFMRSLARRHHLETMQLFGSAVRSDFRPDSDVDILVSYGSGSRPSLASLTTVERELEHAFERDVHLTRVETLRADISGPIRAEAFSLI